MNDINAACAAAHVQLNPQPQQVKSEQSIESRLAKLDELASKNLISESEYQQKRKAILDEF